MIYADPETDDPIDLPQTDNTSSDVQLDERDIILHPFSNPTQNSLPGSKLMDFDTIFQAVTETSHGDNLLVVPDVWKENVLTVSQ